MWEFFYKDKMIKNYTKQTIKIKCEKYAFYTCGWFLHFKNNSFVMKEKVNKHLIDVSICQKKT